MFACLFKAKVVLYRRLARQAGVFYFWGRPAGIMFPIVSIATIASIASILLIKRRKRRRPFTATSGPFLFKN